jgi:hypothetical protein
MPYPAVVVAPDGRLVAANTAADLLTEGAAADLLEPPVNASSTLANHSGSPPARVS